MTYAQKLVEQNPGWNGDERHDHMVNHCPTADRCMHLKATEFDCINCWMREIPEPTDPTSILDVVINPLNITFYPTNIPNPDEMLANVINTASAIKDRPVYITIM